MQLQTIKVEYEGGTIAVRAFDEADAIARLHAWAADGIEATLADGLEDETKDDAGDETDDVEVETESTENDPEA